jgi:hypothetical protein
MKRFTIPLLCLATLALTPPALACSCLCDQPTASVSAAQLEQQEIDRAAYVFSGRIVKRTATSITIRPIEILKGKPVDEITVWESGPSTCRGGLPVRTGFVKVIAYDIDGRLLLSPCTYTCARGVLDRLVDEPR